MEENIFTKSWRDFASYGKKRSSVGEEWLKELAKASAPINEFVSSREALTECFETSDGPSLASGNVLAKRAYDLVLSWPNQEPFKTYLDEVFSEKAAEEREAKKAGRK